MVQLQLNQGPQDALLYNNGRSYFVNVGYVRTSNFQIEYQNVESQNAANFGSTVQFVIPKAADLLGPVDLMCDVGYATLPSDDSLSGLAASGSGDSAVAAQSAAAYAFLVDEPGFAMIEKVTFSVGSNDIESITGEQLQLINELMTTDEQRLGSAHVLRTGRVPYLQPNQSLMTADTARTLMGVQFPEKDLRTKVNGMTTAVSSGASLLDLSNGYTEHSRLLAVHNTILNNKSATQGSEVAKPIILGKKRLIIPLGLFFTLNPSKYFPLAAVAGCNDVRISIRFRSANVLVDSAVTGYTTSAASKIYLNPSQYVSLSDVKLRCHYVHVTGPEATVLMNQEHVRLLKLWHSPNQKVFTPANGNPGVLQMDLSFLHPVVTLIVTLRCNEEIDNTGVGQQKGYFNYHGDGRPTRQGKQGDDGLLNIDVTSISLTINGQERHPALGQGIETHYMRNRLLPMLHSNASVGEDFVAYHARTKSTAAGKIATEINHVDLIDEIYGGAKNVFVVPFSLAPESANPAGAVNFSKVSHAKLNIHYGAKTAGWDAAKYNLRVDVHAVYYNWLSIKDGRALLSFA